MYRPLALFIGLRYTRARKRNQLISFVSIISMLGIALGVLVLIAVLSVINASTSTMRDETLKSVPHASITVPASEVATTGAGDRDGLIGRLLAVPGIEGAAPYVQGEAWLRFQGHADFIELRGVDPLQEFSVTEQNSSRFMGLMNELAQNPDGVLMGSQLAARLGALPGDRVDLTALGSLTAGSTDAVRSFRVLGVTDFGFYGNRNTALVDLDAARALFSADEAARQLRIRLRVDDVFRAGEIAAAGITQLPGADYEWVSWEQSQASLFNALRMEKRLTGFMLLMIVIIGAVNIVSTLVMVVADKNADIAILRTMGAGRGTIMAIFVTQGISAGILGTITGTALGVILVANMGALTAWFEGVINRWVAPEQVYMMSHLRAELQWPDVALIAAGAMLISLAATLYPAWRAARVEAAEVLRYE